MEAAESPIRAAETLALITLALCWACTLSASCLLVSIGPLAAFSLGAPEALAPFTCGVFLLGAALVSVPSASLFGACGRRGGFLCGSACGVAGGVMGLLDVILDLRAIGIFGACFLVGLAQGLGQFYRFAALEVCAPTRKPLALGLVLSGGVIAAFAGPQLAIVTRSIGPTASIQRLEAASGGGDGEDVRFAGSFSAIIALHLLNASLSPFICMLPPRRRRGARNEPLLPDGHAPPAETASGDACPAAVGVSSEVAEASAGAVNGSKPPEWQPRPSLWRLMSQPRCIVAVGVSAVAQSAMVGLMSPLALAMEADGLAHTVGTYTYEAHFACMYAPGLLLSPLMARLGPLRTATVGAALFGGAFALLATGSDAAHFMAGMVRWPLPPKAPIPTRVPRTARQDNQSGTRTRRACFASGRSGRARRTAPRAPPPPPPPCPIPPHERPACDARESARCDVYACEISAC